MTASSEWMEQDQDGHINTLEVRAVLKVLFTFQDRMTCQNLVLMSNNTSLVACINKQGRSVSRSPCQLTQEIFLWMETKVLQSCSNIHSREAEHIGRPAELARSRGPYIVVASSMCLQGIQKTIDSLFNGPKNKKKKKLARLLSLEGGCLPTSIGPWRYTHSLYSPL